MHSPRWWFFLAAAAAVSMMSVAADEKEDETVLSHLAWLEGKWSGPFEGGTWEAWYTSPSAGLMMSANKEINAGRIKMFEFERFTEEAGDVVLVPYPNGRESVEFELVDFDPKVKRAKFVNEQHDFPQEIVYALKEKDRLVIDVFATRDGHRFGFQLELRRTKT